MTKQNLLLSFICFNFAPSITLAQEISSDFNFESIYIEIFGSKMHYVDEYGDPTNPDQLTFLFLHGNPTSNYLWRNIIPYMEKQGRAVAPDLIGMGKSAKPAIDYSLQDHINYLDEFIDQKNLRNIVLVIHDWGSALGFDYASGHEDNIKGIVFMEAITKPPKWKDGSMISRFIFKRLRDEKKGHKMIAERNFFIKQFLFRYGTKRKLTDQEKAYYKAPYPNVASRKVLEAWPKQIPFDGSPQHNQVILARYAKWLGETHTPMLLLYVRPGMIIKNKDVKRLNAEIIDLQTVYIGKGRHFMQEDHPHEVGEAIRTWISKLK